MIKLKTITILTVTIMLFIGGVVFATTGKVYNTSQGLVLRGSASKTGEPIQTVNEGKEVEIIEKDGDWYKVKVDGKEGYLYAEYVKVQEETQPTAEETTTPATEETEANESTEETENGNNVATETKIHLLPSMSSTSIGTIPAEGAITVEKTLGKWNYISFEGLKGWIRVNSEIVKVEEKEEQPEEEKEEETEAEETKPEETTTAAEDTNVSFTQGYINATSGVNLREQPSTTSKSITTLLLNTGVTITAQTDEWYKVTYGDYVGYIHKSLISKEPVETQTTTTTTTSSRSSETRTAPETTSEETTSVASSGGSSSGSSIADFAKQYIGCSYTYGGTSPSTGFDCSGFAQYVYSSNGYSLSGRGASSQAQSGTAVSRDNLQPGDLLVFSNGGGGSIGHVGIYIGDGMMVHAANPSRGVVTDTINSGYYNTYYYSARRIAN